MPAHIQLFTDPACSWSWSIEPTVRKLIVEFGADLDFTLIMGGLARDFGDPGAQLEHWIEVAAEVEMPFDPMIWRESPISSSYPACMAVKAAAEQGPGAAIDYLRAVREGLFCFRRKIDAPEALIEEARRAGLDVERFRADLGSHAIVESFGADLELTRTVPDAAHAAGKVEQSAGVERLSFPSARFSGEGGERWIFGPEPLENWLAAAREVGAGASDDGALGVEAALRRFPMLATTEIATLCGLPGPRAPAELWRLAADWKVKPIRVLTGYLWERT